MVKPTPILYRNFLAMEAEALLHSDPVNGCVLLGDCAKLTPGRLVSAFSTNLPAAFCPAGQRLSGRRCYRPTGARPHTKTCRDELETGAIKADCWIDLKGAMTHSNGI